MNEYILHMHNHAGWHTQRIDADNVADALKKGLDARAEFLSKEYDGLYRIEHDDPSAEYPRFRVIWDSDDPKTFPLSRDALHRGDVWWSDRFQVGEPDDCEKCGGIGVNHYNPFVQCWACGDDKKRGHGSGKAPQKGKDAHG